MNLLRLQPTAIVMVCSRTIFAKGHYGETLLDGLNALGLGSFKGNIWAGKTKVTLGLFFDERG